jgi:hypothetical protein
MRGLHPKSITARCCRSFGQCRNFAKHPVTKECFHHAYMRQRFCPFGFGTRWPPVGGHARTGGEGRNRYIGHRRSLPGTSRCRLAGDPCWKQDHRRQRSVRAADYCINLALGPGRSNVDDSVDLGSATGVDGGRGVNLTALQALCAHRSNLNTPFWSSAAATSTSVTSPALTRRAGTHGE